MTLPPDMQWVINPGVITGAIQLLVGVVAVAGTLLVTVGGALIGVLLWYGRKMDEKIDRIAISLEGVTLATTIRMTKIEAKCEANHANHQRQGDCHE